MGGTQSLDSEQAEAAKIADSFLLAFQSHYLSVYSTIVFDRRCISVPLQQLQPGTTAPPPSYLVRRRPSVASTVSASPSNSPRPPEAQHRRNAAAAAAAATPHVGDDNNPRGYEDDAEQQHHHHHHHHNPQYQLHHHTVDSMLLADSGASSPTEGVDDVNRAMSLLAPGKAAAAAASGAELPSSVAVVAASKNTTSRSATGSTKMGASAAPATAVSATNLLAGMPLDIGQHNVRVNLPFDSRNWWVKRQDTTHNLALAAARERKKTSFRSAAAVAVAANDENNSSNNGASAAVSFPAVSDASTTAIGSSDSPSRTSSIASNLANSTIGIIHPLSVCPDVIDLAISPNIHISNRHRGMLLSLSTYMKRYEARYLAVQRNWQGCMWHWEEEFKAGEHPNAGRIDFSLYADGGIFLDATEAAQFRMRELADLFSIDRDSAPESECYPLRTVELFERRSAAQGEESVLQMGAREEYWQQWVQRLEQAAALASPYHIDDDAAHALAFRHAIDRAWDDLWRIYRPSTFSSSSGAMPQQQQQQHYHSEDSNTSRFFSAGPASSSSFQQQQHQQQQQARAGSQERSNHNDDNSSPPSSSYIFSDVPPFPRHGGGELSMLVTALYHLLYDTVLVKYVHKKALDVAEQARRLKQRLSERERERQREEESQRKKLREEHEAMMRKAGAANSKIDMEADDHDDDDETERENINKFGDDGDKRSASSVVRASGSISSPKQRAHARASPSARAAAAAAAASFLDDDDDEDGLSAPSSALAVRSKTGAVEKSGSTLSSQQREQQQQQQQQQELITAAASESEKKKRRGADAEWTTLRPYYEALQKVILDESSKGVSIAWNTTAELVKKRGVRLDCATQAELLQAATAWRRLQERASNALGRCPFIGTVSSLIKRLLSQPMIAIAVAASASTNGNNNNNSEEQESITLALVRIFTNASNKLPIAVDELVATAMNVSTSATHSTTASSLSVDSKSSATAAASSPGVAKSGVSSSGSKSTAATVSTTARKGSLLYTVMSRGFPAAFLEAQDELLAPQTCAAVEALCDTLHTEFTDMASEFLVSDSKCRATVGEWAERRCNPYAANAALGRALRLQSLLFADACHTFDLLTLSAGVVAVPSSTSSGDKKKAADGNTSSTMKASPRTDAVATSGAGAVTTTTPIVLKEGSALANVKNRLENQCVRHIREAVAQVLYSVCAVYWEGTVVRWLRRFLHENPSHFSGSGVPPPGGSAGAASAWSGVISLDALEGEKLDPGYAMEDGAYDELLELVRETVSQCIADTL